MRSLGLVLALSCTMLGVGFGLRAHAERSVTLAQQPGAVARFEAAAFEMGSSDEDVRYAVELCRREGQAAAAAEGDAAPCDAMRFANEQPRHRVSLAAYAIDRREVRNADYQRCVNAGACAPRRVLESDDRFGRPEQPVVQVTAAEAESFCAFVRGRLPTEAEWEQAARAGTARRFPWGEQWSPRRANAGPSEATHEPVDGHRFAAPVGSFPDGATPHGLLDMAGNVWELTADRFDPQQYTRAPQVDPRSTRGEQRVMRGGSYATPPYALRTTQRASIGEDEPRPDVGFRCAYDVPRVLAPRARPKTTPAP